MFCESCSFCKLNENMNRDLSVGLPTDTHICSNKKSLHYGDYISGYKFPICTKVSIKEEEPLDVRNSIVLPFEMGSIIYDYSEFFNSEYSSPDVYELNTSEVTLVKDGKDIKYVIDGVEYKEDSFYVNNKENGYVFNSVLQAQSRLSEVFHGN